MASMNNWLGFSLSPQELPPPHHQDHHSENSVSRHDFNSDEISGTDVSGECFDLTSHDSSLPSLNLPPPFGILEAFNRNHHQSPQDWSMNSGNNYRNSSELSMLMGGGGGGGGGTAIQNLENQVGPKLENFLGVGSTISSAYHHSNGDYTMYPNCSLQLPSDAAAAATETPTTTDIRPGNSGGGGVNSNTIGLSMIKNWLRSNPAPQQADNKNGGGNEVTGTNIGNAQALSLSMSTGSQSSSPMTMQTAASGGGGGGESCSSDNKRQMVEATPDSQNGVVEAVPRKSIDTFGQRTSIYRGVTRHRWTGRYEAHLWDNSCRREGQTRKGRQGGYDKEEKAARAYDLAALKYWGTTTTTNFPISNYEKEVEDMKHMTRQEYVASLRRKSSGFSRGASIYRGVTRHHQHGRWQARIGRVAGNKDLYLGTFSTQEEAAEAYDIAAIKFRGLNAVTNFEISRYDVKSILESSTLPIGGAAKRLKDAEQAEMTMDVRRMDDNSITSHLTDATNWPSIACQQAQPFSMHYPYGQQRLWCKQEQDADVTHSFQDLHQLQLGNTHNFFQPSVLHNLMNLDSSSMEHSSGSNSVIYSDGNSGSGNNVTYQGGVGYGSVGGYVIPNGTIVAQEGNQISGNGFGDNEVKALGYENAYGSTDAYNARNMYYLSQNSSAGAVKATVYYDQGSACNNWVPTAVPALAPRTNGMAVCHGAPTFTVWNDT
ncbi:hypothetical protein RJ639_045448 [Escallonia herrerae]|uniref:AP2/ERF domain-containing protein n=1 Tax=Escallonia herrerae TaxID=1293975 RepID=A0AA89B3G7_9ASTE|nr:hypothetical protein RJ639_045448 [Escallonia herrerae]